MTTDLQIAARQSSDHWLTFEPNQPYGEVPPESGENAPRPGEKAPERLGDAAPQGLNYNPVFVPENDDPLRRRIVRPVHLGKVARLFKRLFTRRALTAEEIAEQEEKRDRLAMEKVLRADAHDAQAMMIRALTNLGICYRYPKSKNDFLMQGVQEVRFSHVVMQPEALYFKIDTSHLPRNISVMQMVAPDVLSHLSVALQRHVSAKFNEHIGAWFVVARNSSIGGIPSFVRYSDMMKYFPASADGLTIPIGMGLNSRRLYKSIAKMPHGLIAGTTGGGKSNAINFILCTLIQRNTPQQLGLVLVDLKGGMELSRYKNIPHLMTMPGITETGIVKERAGVPTLLDWMIHEGKRRQGVIEQAGRSDVMTYNAAQRSHPERRLKPILIVVDELSDILLDRELKKATLEKMILIAQQFRAVGIHMLLCTQTPTREVIPTLLKSNLPAKMAFPCSSNTASIIIIDGGDARGLPTGRCVYDHTEKTIVQTPYISPDVIRAIIERARAGQFTVDTSGRDLTEVEVLEWALDNMGGKLSVEKLFAQFQHRITWADLVAMMQGIEGREFELGGQVWRVLPPAGSAPRKLDLIREDETPAENAAPEVYTPAPAAPEETFADALRALLAGYECKIIRRDISGERVLLPLDEFLFTDVERRERERELLGDLKKICERFGAVSVAGGFAINGRKVKLK